MKTCLPVELGLPVKFGLSSERPCLVNAVPRLCAGVDSQEEDFGTTSTSGGNHSFAESELHLARL